MNKFKYHFLIASMILVFMGAMMKLENFTNYRPSFIAGILNFSVFMFFYMTDRRKKLS
jgi:K+-sensing histidine kinase KdpD